MVKVSLGPPAGAGGKGTYKKQGLFFACPVVVNDTLTITNEAIGNTTFTKTFTSAHDIIFQDDIGTHLEFKENNRATFSGDIYAYGASKKENTQ